MTSEYEEEAWFSRPEFKRYWELQARVNDWQRRHLATLQNLQSVKAFSFPPPIPPPPPPPWISKLPNWDELTPAPTPHSFPQYFNNSPSNLNPGQNVPGTSSSGAHNYVPSGEPPLMEQGNDEFVEESDEDYEESDDHEEYENEELGPEAAKQLDEKMVAFFRQTVLHRMEREKEKTDLKAQGLWFMPTTEDYVDPDKAQRQAGCSTLPPNVEQSHEKAERAREEYGERGDSILAAEVLLRMKFEDEMNKSKPNFWPNLPLNL